MRNILCVPLLVLTSCVSVNMTSNKSDGYNKKLSRVYIYYFAAKGVDEYLTKYSNGLTSQFSTLGIQSKSEIRNPLSLDTEEDVATRVNEYKPSHLMLYKITRITYSNGFAGTVDFEISIIDSATNKVIWKSVMTPSVQMYLRDAVEMSLSKTIDKLKSDGII